MNKHLTVLLLLLAVGLVVAYFGWAYVEQAKTADLTLAVVRQPREELVVSGYLKNFRAAPFSLESLSIEEPGKEPYRRQISLDSDRKFELTLGKPTAGTYRVAVRTRKANWQGEGQEGWLQFPDFVVAEGDSSRPQVVAATDYDYRQVSLVVAVVAAIAAILMIVLFRLLARNRSVAFAHLLTNAAAAGGRAHPS